MLVTLDGIVTFVRFLHSWNIPGTMLVILSGIVTLVIPQPENAPFPMLDKLFGIVKLVS